MNGEEGLETGKRAPERAGLEDLKPNTPYLSGKPDTGPVTFCSGKKIENLGSSDKGASGILANSGPS